MSDETQSPDFREKLAQSFADDLEEMAQRAADSEGQPMGARKVGDARALRLYGLKDPNVDPERMLEALQSTGLPQEILDPSNPKAMLIIKENPDLAKYYAQPAKTPEAAETLVHWAEHPFMYGLVMGIDDPHERVSYAAHLDQLWQQSQPQTVEPAPMTTVAGATDHSAQFAPPEPAPPDPSMPMQPPGPAPMPDPRQMMGG